MSVWYKIMKNIIAWHTAMCFGSRMLWILYRRRHYRAILKSDLLKQPEYADTWICRIVIHEALRFLKKNKQTASVEEVPEQGQEDKIEDVDLQRALDKLDEKERSIVVLRYFEEEKIETIGQIMNLNVSTVKSKLYRAMDKLKKYMEAGGVNYGRLEKGV